MSNQSGVIGLGGIFIKFDDPNGMRDWYRNTLGITTNDYGILFEFGGADTKPGYLQLGTFEASSTYFGSDRQRCMLNFRVGDLEAFAKQLDADGVTILDDIESYEYGKFLHIEDPEGNRIELWEPIDHEFSHDRSSIMPLR